MGVPELNFIFSFIFISFILPCFVLKAIQSCLQHTYKIRLSLRKCKQVRNKHKEDKLQPAGWPVCGMNSVKLYIVDRDGPHVHPWVFQPPTQRGTHGGWYDFYFIWRTMKHSQENKAKWLFKKTGEKVLPCPLLSRTLWTSANGGAKFVILCDPTSHLQGIQEAFELSESTVPR